MLVPMINLNGTYGPELLAQHRAVWKALHKVKTAMGDAFPNGRDFQTMPPGTHQQAMTEATTRLRLIEQMILCYDGICAELSEQIEAREASRARR